MDTQRVGSENSMDARLLERARNILDDAENLYRVTRRDPINSDRSNSIDLFG